MHKCFIYLAITVMGLLQQGCFTGGTLMMSPNSKTVTKTISSKVVAEDIIYAVGHIDNKEILAKHPNTVAMVGKNAVYVLVEGGERFNEISQKLDGNRLFSANKFNKKMDEEEPFEVEVINGTIRGSRRFYYEKSKNDLSSAEIETIKKSKHLIGDHGSTFAIDFAGFIPKTQVELQGPQTNFKIERKITLREIQTQNETALNMEKYISLPFAVILDVMLLPVEALFFTVVYVDNHSK